MTLGQHWVTSWLVADDAKLLPEAILTYDQLSHVALIWGQLYRKMHKTFITENSFENYKFQIISNHLRSQWVQRKHTPLTSVCGEFNWIIPILTRRYFISSFRYCSLQCRHNGRDVVSSHQPYDYLLNRLFRCRSKKTAKLRVTGLCAGNSPVNGEFSA